MKKTLMFLFISILLIITGCGVNSSETAGANKKKASNEVKETGDELPTIKIGWSNNGYPSPFTFSSAGPGGFLHNNFLFDTLTWKDDTGIIPWLAKEWNVSDDGLTYEFQLEKDVSFHDGKPLTADDVVFTFDYFAKNPFPWNADISYVKSVKKLDDYSVEVTLKEAYSPFITEVAGILPILPKHIWEKVDQPLEYTEKDAVIGSGPFVLDHYDEKDGNYLFLPNENFFKGTVAVKEVQYLNVENRVLSLQNDEINAGMTFMYSDVEEMKEKGFDVIKSEPTGSAVRIVFNLEHDQLGDKRLRQALAYALDRETLAEKATGGGEPIVGSAGIVPPDSAWYNKDVKQYDYNLEKAERMLDELGYKKNSKGIREDLKLNVMVSDTSSESQLMQEMLKKIGVELNIQQVDQATFTTALGENNYDMAITGHIGLSGDPDFLRLWFTGEASNAYAARGKSFKNKEFHKLADKQLGILDEKDRKVVIDQMQDILADELPTLVLYHRPFYFIYDSQQFDGWFNTAGGIADGIPLWENKAAFINAD